jgi:hypothetical protein
MSRVTIDHHQIRAAAGAQHGQRLLVAQVVEGEHQLLDALGRVAVRLLQRGQEARFGVAVEIIENFRHHLVGVAAALLRQIVHEFGAERLLDALDDVLLHRLHA